MRGITGIADELFLISKTTNYINDYYDYIIGDIMGQQTYIKTKYCEMIHKLGHIKADKFNEFVESAIEEKIEREKEVLK